MSESLSPGRVPEQPLSSLSGVGSRRFSIRWRAWLVALFGSLLAVAAMGAQPAFPGGFALGLTGCVICVAGLLSLMLGGARADGPSLNEHDCPVLLSRTMVSPALQGLAASVATFGLLRVAVAGSSLVEGWALGWALSATFLWGVISLLVVARRLGFVITARPGQWWEHRGLWLLVFTTILYLPGLGTFGLIDPWESHYGEVSREMLARRDWISLWWAEGGWFQSKPILDFWAQALSFSTLGVPFGSDEMLQGVSRGWTPGPEWAARFPFFLFALLGQHVLFVGARLHLGRRAALLGALVLATCPQWYFLARQSMVDMLYVAPLSCAMGLILIALGSPSAVSVREFPLRWRTACSPFVVHSADLLWGAVLLLVVPQVLYLVSRNVSFAWESWPVGYFAHSDYVRLGSPDNCGLPGNRACGVHGASAKAALQPVFAATIWAISAAALCWKERHTRGLARLCYLGAWLFAALSFMAKGAPGLVLVLFSFLGTVVATGRYRELQRCAPGALLLMLACVAAPWFVQQYVRLGFGFIEELFLKDMIKRAFGHVHDTNSGIDVSFRYYVWQLGYALFPWSGVAAVGSLFCIGRYSGRRLNENAAVAIVLLMVWQLAAFGMFSIAGTKFHHYIFPLVPPAAMLGGVFLDELWSREKTLALGGGYSHRAISSGVIFISVAALCWGLDQLLPGSVLGSSAAGENSRVWGVCAAGAGLLLFGLTAHRTGGDAKRSNEPFVLPLLALAAGVLVLLVGRDLASRPTGDVEGQSRLLSLFCYTYTRAWPRLIDFSGWLAALAVAFAGLTSLALIGRIRRAVVVGLFCVATVSAVWGINVYLPQLAVHWGQRATLEKYYERRTGPEQPVIAYQLNWKGENFYTGNHLVVFKVSGKKFKDWVAAEKKKGVKVMFFATEHARIPTLKRELGKIAKLEELTGKDLSSKFLMVRVEL